MTREDEVKKLCELILETDIKFDHSDNTPDNWYCHFCCGTIYENGTMDQIKHHPDCEYSIARGLMTGIIAT